MDICLCNFLGQVIQIGHTQQRTKTKRCSIIKIMGAFVALLLVISGALLHVLGAVLPSCISDAGLKYCFEMDRINPNPSVFILMTSV